MREATKKNHVHKYISIYIYTIQ